MFVVFAESLPEDLTNGLRVATSGPGLVRCSTISGPLNSSAHGFFNIFPEVSFQFCHVDISRMKGLGMAILTYIHTYLRHPCIPASVKPVPFPLPGLTSVPGIPTSSTPPFTPSAAKPTTPPVPVASEPDVADDWEMLDVEQQYLNDHTLCQL